jgi:hypothetical protein
VADAARYAIFQAMDRQEILARLRENEPALRARGVRHVALFGSRARGEAGLGSDIDIMIEFSPEARVTVFNYAGLKDFIASLGAKSAFSLQRRPFCPQTRALSPRRSE